MSVLVDTNLLTKLADLNQPKNSIVNDAVKYLLGKGETAYILPQNVYEFWAVATRPPANNGLGMTSEAANARLDEILGMFILLPDTAEIFAQWRRLVRNYDCKGKPSHDARLVAGMIVHQIPTIVTFNKQDFIRYSAITIFTPDEVLLQRP